MRGTIAHFVLARGLNTLSRAVITAVVLWELYDRTHDKLVLAAVGLVQVLPQLLLFGLAGALVDRLDRRLLATVSAMVTGALGLALAVSSAFSMPVGVYLGLLFAQGCTTCIHAPAAASLLPMIAPRDDLVRANRLVASLRELAQILGPALAGLALLALAPHWVYMSVAATGVASASLFCSLPTARAIRIDAAGARDWRIGFHFIFRSPLLLPAMTLDMIAVLFAGVTAILPAIATDILHVGPFGYGILRSSQSVGAVAMALLGGRLPAWKRPGRVLLIVVALFGVATMGIGWSTSLPVTIVLLTSCGALDNISVVIRMTMEQLIVPDAIRGRVSAAHSVFLGVSNELGAAESGLASELVGTVPAIVAGGALALVVAAMVAIRWPALARMPPLGDLRPPPNGSR